MNELRAKSESEITDLIKELDSEIFQLRNELRMTRKLEKPHLLKEKKKQRAQAFGVLTEKQQKAEDGSK